jgi:hypothetical protein
VKRFVGHDVAAAFWESFIEDAKAIAGEDRFADWETTVLRPGDVTARDPALDPVDVDVLVGGDQFELLERWVEEEGRAFERAEVYRREKDGVVFVLAAFLDEASSTGVFIPLFYVPSAAEEMVESVRDRGTIRIGIRPLTGDQYVTFEHERAELFLPPAEE